MKVEYKKDLHHNFMVISEIETVNEEAYCMKLQKLLQLDGLLRMERRTMDNQVLCYYDITGKQSVTSLFEKGNLTYDRIKKFFLELLITLEKGYEYLLNEDDFILIPEYIFMDAAASILYLCYLSGYGRSIQEQISNLIEYLMNKVDYNDKDAVLMVYEMYAASKEEHFNIDSLNAIINGTKRGSRSENTKTTMKKATESNQNMVDREDINSNEPGKESAFKVKQREEQRTNPTNGLFMMEKLVDEQEVICYPIKTYLYTGFCGLGSVILLILGFSSKLLYNSFGNRIDVSKLFGLLFLIFIADGYVLRKIWDKKNRITKMVTRNEYIDPLVESHRINHGFIQEEPSDYYGEESFKSKENSMKIKALDKVSLRSSHRARMDVNKNDHKFDQKKVQQDNIYQDINVEQNCEYGEDVYNHGDKKIAHRLNYNDLDERETENPTCVLNEINDKPTPILKALDDVIGNNNNQASIILLKFPFFIGKLKKNVDLYLDQDIISRYHAKITRENNRYYLTDLNSTNGTFHNGIELLPYETKELTPGDEVAFANLKFIFLEIIN